MCTIFILIYFQVLVVFWDFLSIIMIINYPNPKIISSKTEHLNSSTQVIFTCDQLIKGIWIINIKLTHQQQKNYKMENWCRFFQLTFISFVLVKINLETELFFYCTGACWTGICCGWAASTGGRMPLMSLYGLVISSSSFGVEMSTWSGSGFLGPILPVAS